MRTLLMGFRKAAESMYSPVKDGLEVYVLLFGLDLQNAQQRAIRHRQTPQHVEEIRVVRQVTGRTVVDYINQMLLMEASFLLQTSPLSITQIVDRLHFADTPSFSKFLDEPSGGAGYFSRLKGVSPKEYRKG